MLKKYLRHIFAGCAAFALVFSLSGVSSMGAFFSYSFVPFVHALDCDGDGTDEGATSCDEDDDSDTGTLTADELFGDLESGDEFADIAGLGSQDLATTIASIIRVALGFLGVLAVALIIIGGFKWMVAGGDQPKVDKAQKLIIYGVVGLVIVLAAYAIAFFVIESITTAVAG